MAETLFKQPKHPSLEISIEEIESVKDVSKYSAHSFNLKSGKSLAIPSSRTTIIEESKKPGAKILVCWENEYPMLVYGPINEEKLVKYDIYL